MWIISWTSYIPNPPGRWSLPRDRNHGVSADRCCPPPSQSAASCASSPDTRRTQSSACPPEVLSDGATKQIHLKASKSQKMPEKNKYFQFFTTYLPEMEAVIGCECDQSALPRNKKDPGWNWISHEFKALSIEFMLIVSKLYHWVDDMPEHSKLLPLMLSEQFYPRGSKNP